MLLNCMLDFVDAGKDNISAFFWGSASRPAGLPRYGGGAAQGRGRPSDDGLNCRLIRSPNVSIEACRRIHIYLDILHFNLLALSFRLQR